MILMINGNGEILANGSILTNEPLTISNIQGKEGETIFFEIYNEATTNAMGYNSVSVYPIHEKYFYSEDPSVNATGYKFTERDILKLINSKSVVRYDSIAFTDDFQND